METVYNLRWKTAGHGMEVSTTCDKGCADDNVFVASFATPELAEYVVNLHNARRGGVNGANGD